MLLVLEDETIRRLVDTKQYGQVHYRASSYTSY